VNAIALAIAIISDSKSVIFYLIFINTINRRLKFGKLQTLYRRLCY
jgi:hypothetical protein